MRPSDTACRGQEEQRLTVLNLGEPVVSGETEKGGFLIPLLGISLQKKMNVQTLVDLAGCSD
jgi:hypothetical protein